MNKKLKSLIILNSIFLITTIITDILYITLKTPYVFKTIASLNFVLCSILNITLMIKLKFLVHKKFSILMFIGMIFAFCGDILLIEKSLFELGAISFGIGHIFYTIAYITIKKFKPTDLIPIIAIIGIALIVIFTSNITLGSLMPLIIAYALIISFMLGKSTTLIKYNKQIGLLLSIGSLLFFLSDMFLMFDLFSDILNHASTLCLSFYYPAVFILSMSIGFVNYILNTKN